MNGAESYEGSEFSEYASTEQDGKAQAPPSPSRAIPTLFKLDPTMLKKTEGWVWKKGGIGANGIRRRNWKKRWFQLIEQRTETYPKYDIEYYDKPGGLLKGTIELEGAEVFTEERNKFTLKRKRFEWQILLANGQTVLLASELSAANRDEWVISVNMIIAYLIKMRRASGFTLEGYDPLYEEEEAVYEVGEKLAQNCQAFGPGLFGAEVGVAAKFFIQMHDLNGKALDVGGMPFTATLGDEEVLYHIKVRDHGDGSYSAHYVLRRPGMYSLRIMLNSNHDIYGSPYEVEILPSKTVSRECTAEGEGLEMVRMGQLTSFVITARDLFGNSKNRGGDPFEVGVMGPAQVASLADNGDGTYLCTLEGKVPELIDDLGTHTLLVMVTLHGKHVKNSPFQPVLDLSASNVETISRSQMEMNTSSQSQRKAPSILREQFEIPPPPTPSRRSVAALRNTNNRSMVNENSGNENSNVQPQSHVEQSEQDDFSVRSGMESLGEMSQEQNQTSLSRLRKARDKAMRAKAGNAGDDSSVGSSAKFVPKGIRTGTPR